jgi:hypothetical protein
MSTNARKQPRPIRCAVKPESVSPEVSQEVSRIARDSWDSLQSNQALRSISNSTGRNETEAKSPGLKRKLHH